MGEKMKSISKIIVVVVLLSLLILLNMHYVFSETDVSVQLDGDKDEIQVSDDDNLDGYSQATWNIWAKQDSYVSGAGLIGKYATGVDNRAYLIRTVLDDSISVVLSSNGVNT